MVVLVISVVVKVWTVIGCCHEGKGAFVLLRVQWLLFYADMMPLEKTEQEPSFICTKKKKRINLNE